MGNSKALRLIGVIILAVFLNSGCSSTREPIRIGVNNWPPCEVWYVAREKGYFKEVPVEIVRYLAWTDNMASLYLGKTDITHSTYFNHVYYSDKGEPAVMLAPIDFIEGGDGLVIKNSIADIQDLKGKKIAVEIGTDEHYLLYKALEKHNINIDDVNIVSIPSYESYKNFISGEIDALFTYEPFLSQAAAEGGGRIAFTTRELPGYMVDALLTREAVSKSRTKDLQIIMEAWYQALDYIKKNPEEAYRIMAVNEGMKEEDFKAFYEGFSFFSKEEAKTILKSEGFRSLLRELSRFCFEYKLTETEVDVDSLLKNVIR